MQSPLLAVAIFTLILPQIVNAQERGNASAGLAFARANCAECHAVTSSEDISANPDAPPFASVAGTPGMTGTALAVWLQTSHPTMPDFMIAEDDRDNVIAYIMSLKASPKP